LQQARDLVFKRGEAAVAGSGGAALVQDIGFDAKQVAFQLLQAQLDGGGGGRGAQL